MDGSRQIYFTVSTMRDGGAWAAEGRASEMHAAVKAAQQLVRSKQFRDVKVEQTFHDTVNDRTVCHTIFRHGDRASGPSLLVWLLLAVAAGAASFAITYGLSAW